MQVLVSGVNGFIGSRLRMAMQEKGWEVIPLERKDFALDAHILGIKLSGADVIIHLAGAPIVHRWNEAYKKELRNSRINTTRKLVEALSLEREKPILFISTSAIGIYSATGSHSEVSSSTADDFIGKLCLDWEKEAVHAASITRTVIFRLGIVLAKDGGAFPKMLLPFKFGLGGKIGSGKQGFSWIHIDDLIAAYLFVIDNVEMNVAINLTSPEPCNNAEFTNTLATLIRRPAFFTVPLFALKLIYGEGATAVTGGQTVIPDRLMKAGFGYNFPTLAKALANILK